MSNPRIRSHLHRKAPSMMFWRTVRGMLPNYTPRGLECLRRLRCYDGVPAPFFSAPRMKVPEAMVCKIMKPARKHCTLGEIATAIGWKHGEEVAKLEVTRKTQALTYHKNKFGSKKKEWSTNEK